MLFRFTLRSTAKTCAYKEILQRLHTDAGWCAVPTRKFVVCELEWIGDTACVSSLSILCGVQLIVWNLLLFTPFLVYRELFP